MIHLNLTGEFEFNELVYNIAMTTSQIVGTTVNVFTFFLIWKYSTPDMKYYKKHLLMYQFSCLFLDFGIDVLTTPVFFFPLPAGTAQGILNRLFGVSTFWCYVSCLIANTFRVKVSMMSFSCFFVPFIVCNLIFYRWQLILPEGHWLKFTKTWSWCLVNYWHIPFAMIPPIFMYILSIDSEDDMRKEFQEQNPNDIALISVDGFFWGNFDKRPSFIVALVWHSAWFIYDVGVVMVSSISSVGTLNNLEHRMSAETREVHFRILLQTAVPCIHIAVPCVYWITIIRHHVRFPRMQDVTNFTVMMICTHGLVSSLFVIYFNKPLAKAVHKMFIGTVRQLLKKEDTTRPAATRVIPISQVETSYS